jgi:hypothetical protein
MPLGSPPGLEFAYAIQIFAGQLRERIMACLYGCWEQSNDTTIEAAPLLNLI